MPKKNGAQQLPKRWKSIILLEKNDRSDRLSVLSFWGYYIGKILQKVVGEEGDSQLMKYSEKIPMVWHQRSCSYVLFSACIDDLRCT